MAKSLPITNKSLKCSNSNSISHIPMQLGSAAPMKTPTVCSDNISQRSMTSPSCLTKRLSKPCQDSILDHENLSVSKYLLRCSTTHPLHLPLEFTCFESLRILRNSNLNWGSRSSCCNRERDRKCESSMSQAHG